MSNWKVSKEQIKLFPHPNADKLQLGKVGTYQVVVQTGLYQDGDVIVFAPEKSVLTGKLLEEYQQYLVGVHKNRVKAIALRGEISAGIIIPQQFWPGEVEDKPFGENLSEIFGITKYVAPIPVEMSGEFRHTDAWYSKHDCEQLGVYKDQLIENERVVVTEKLHGSQISIYVGDNEKIVATKHMLDNGHCFIESETNAYWKAVKKDKIFELIDQHYPDQKVQIFGELVRVQGGYSYGLDVPAVKIYDIRVDTVSVPYDQVPDDFKSLWVPVLYDGPYDFAKIATLRKGKETVSGMSMHIREGIVIAPYIDRKASDGTRLRLKYINPDYKETGEEIN